MEYIPCLISLFLQSVVVIGSESNLASVTADIDKVKIESDKEAIKAVQNQEKDYFFNCLYLNQFSSCDCGDEEAVKVRNFLIYIYQNICSELKMSTGRTPLDKFSIYNNEMICMCTYVNCFVFSCSMHCRKWTKEYES